METSNVNEHIKAKVSVIIPVYGVEQYIERCAISLFEQTLDNIEYIFVNDCTRDRSIDVLTSVIERYPNRKSQVKIIEMPQNSGQAAVRKRGLELASGEYIIHCDSDDSIDTRMYEELYTLATNQDCDVVICDFNIVSGESQYHSHQNIPTDKIELLGALLNEKVHGSLCNKLIKSSLYKQVGVLPKDNLLEDLTYSVQLIANSKKHFHINKALYNYYQHSTSITNNRNIEVSIDRGWQAYNNTRLIFRFLKENNLAEELTSEILHLKYTTKYLLRYNCLVQGGYKKWQEVFPEIKALKILNHNFCVTTKLIYLITSIGLYPMLSKIKNLPQ